MADERRREIEQINISSRSSGGRTPQGRPSQGRTSQSRPSQGRAPQGRPTAERRQEPGRRPGPDRGRAPQGRPAPERRQEPGRRPGPDRDRVPQGRPPQGRPPQGRTARRRRRRKSSPLAALLFTLIVVGVLLFYLHSRLGETYTLEAGQDIQVEKLMKHGSGTPVIVQDLTAEQKTTPGDYEVKVKLTPFTYTVKVTVQDTVAPVADGLDVICMYGETRRVEDFVQNIQDSTDVTLAFESTPDFEIGGLQEITVVMTDEGGNVSRAIATLYVSNLMSEITLEAGSAVPEARAFLEDIPGFENTVISYNTEVFSPANIDMSVIGRVEVSLMLDGRACTSALNIVDTKAPDVSVKHIDGWTLKPIAPETFVVTAQDATALSYSYVREPDWTEAGSGSAEIIVTDMAGNTATEMVTYKLKEDKVAPEVSLSIIDIIIGEAVSYKKAVGYSDNADSKAELKLDVDNSKVDPNTEGTYEVTYTVTDTAGNSTTKTGTVNVLAEKPVYYDEDVVNEKADEVLASILKDDMTQLEKARAIYNWVHGKIGYISHSEKVDWVRGAYEGLVKRQGDCYVYACTAKVLLTRAGINNMDIVKSQVNPSHYWNLVDVGDGWYHFDATPRKDKTVFFMWTDDELREYSESHKNTHIYDASLYPEIN